LNDQSQHINAQPYDDSILFFYTSVTVSKSTFLLLSDNESQSAGSTLFLHFQSHKHYPRKIEVNNHTKYTSTTLNMTHKFSPPDQFDISSPDVPLPTCQSCHQPSHFTICKACGTKIVNIDGREFQGMRMYQWVMGESNEGKSPLRDGDGSTTTGSSRTFSTSTNMTTLLGRENVGSGPGGGVMAGGKGRVKKGGAIGKVKRILKSWRGIGKGK
jgi:hypothetical protein